MPVVSKWQEPGGGEGCRVLFNSCQIQTMRFTWESIEANLTPCLRAVLHPQPTWEPGFMGSPDCVLPQPFSACPHISPHIKKSEGSHMLKARPLNIFPSQLNFGVAEKTLQKNESILQVSG